ncbi:dharma [Dunckerocampus dactyliophorus]|uniref:dharma n=1 Tax=Dunckerocampus dactyliophorus TaxID=161453 RepID=UPI00240679E0|nr:dharma [Dunckerocampus dactyliophorus]
MEQSRLSDFSIERILSLELGHKPTGPSFAPDLHDAPPAGFGEDAVNFRPAAPVPMPACFQYFGETFYPYGVGFQHTEACNFYQNSSMFVSFSPNSADVQAVSGCHGYHPAGPPGQLPRQKTRMRTVFTDCQTKHLETLFSITDYPPVEARAQVARSAGLSEETVRVWFKNRRARRKRQCSGSKVKVHSPPPSAGTEKLLRTFV